MKKSGFIHQVIRGHFSAHEEHVKKFSLGFSVLLLLLSFYCTSFALPPLDSVFYPAAPDYTSSDNWLVKPETPTAPVDVFYVYPTVLFNETEWIMKPDSADMHAAAKGAFDTQAVVFDGLANIYAPMYRQMNIAGLNLSDEDSAPLKAPGLDDVWRAFQYYLKYENNGRPFFLAGHSQGSMVITNMMLEHWGATGAENQLIAALILGWSVTKSDLETHSSIVMCDSSAQVGCVISYNTVAAGKQSQAPTILPGAMVTNPLSWTMDSGYVSAENNIGAVFFDKNGNQVVYPKYTSAQIMDSGLVVQPADISYVTYKGGHFPEGVYHAFDYSLFFENLKANIEDRIAAFGK